VLRIVHAGLVVTCPLYLCVACFLPNVQMGAHRFVRCSGLVGGMVGGYMTDS
jgi:hypothetical protein